MTRTSQVLWQDKATGIKPERRGRDFIATGFWPGDAPRQPFFDVYRTAKMAIGVAQANAREEKRRRAKEQ
jgi:hypothetical protein